MLTNEECLWEFNEEDYKNISSLQPVKQTPTDSVDRCFNLGEDIVFPIQEVIAENFEPTVFVINGLPYRTQ